MGAVVVQTLPSPHIRLYRHRAFTLIEILVVVAIIGLLVAILLPSLRRAREQAKTTVCMTQIRQLMTAALMYTQEYQGSLPGSGVNDAKILDQYTDPDSKRRRHDYLSWVGTFWTGVKLDDLTADGLTDAIAEQWDATPQKGRLWNYYKDDKLLKCPSADNFNGKFSYSTPENVAAARSDPTNERHGLPPVMGKVKQTSAAIQFVDEDEENGLSTYSVDDGFGGPDLFGDRHLGQATITFFDGHAEAQYFFRTGPNENLYTDISWLHGYRPARVRHRRNRSPDVPFEAWMIQIAPFNSRVTPRPWKWSGRYADWPKFKAGHNWPGCQNAVGCE